MHPHSSCYDLHYNGNIPYFSGCSHMLTDARMKQTI